MKHLLFISLLFFLLIFSTGCQKYEVIGPDTDQEDITLRHETLINDHIFEMDQANDSENDLRDSSDRPDDGGGITDDDDEDEDNDESQDKLSTN